MRKNMRYLLLIFFSCFLHIYAKDGGLSSIKTTQEKIDFLHKFSMNTTVAARDFSMLQVQNFLGRTEPLYTTAHNAIKKIIHKNTLLNLDPNQIFFGMLFYPDFFSDVKMIYTNDAKINEILGINANEKYAAFSDFFNDGKNGYKLNNFVQEANRIDPAKRGTFEKNIIKIDERINIAFMIFSGSALKIFPQNNGDTAWLNPPVAYKNSNIFIIENIANLLHGVQDAVDLGVEKNEWKDFNEIIKNIQKFQKKHAKNILSDAKIKAEIFLTNNNFFDHLILPYILIGLSLFTLILYAIIRQKNINKKIYFSIAAIIFVCILIHTASLILRAYISGHSPFTNAYESMLYISWASAISGIFFRKYIFALSAAMLLAGISLFVANLGFMDPQISPIMPVLKSYWLNIHVSIITASYGFLGLCFLLGLITLVLFIFRGTFREKIDNSIQLLYALNEQSMIIGTLMLTVGNFLGGIWANESWGRYWSWDPKEAWALISIGVYAIILHLRFTKIIYLPYYFSLASVIGYFSILMTYFGVNYYLSGLHSYAKGDPFPIPIFFYFFISFIFLLIFLSYFKRKLRAPMLKT